MRTQIKSNSQGITNKTREPSEKTPGKSAKPGSNAHNVTNTSKDAGFTFDFSGIPGYRPQVLPLQRKSRVTEPGDQYEQEAENMASQILNKPGETASENDSKPGQVRIQRYATNSRQGLRSVPVPTIVENVIKEPGEPMNNFSRSFFESRFAHDFSNVRIHKDKQAAESADALQANAYTLGRHIVFANKRYDPDSLSGKQLLAHELTHVVQQGGSAALQAVPAENTHSAAGSESFQHNSDPVKTNSPVGIARQPAVAPGEGKPAPPFFGLKAAPDAFKGIVLMYNVKSLPFSSHVDTAQLIKKGPYLIAPNLVRNPDNSSSISYYIAFRKEPGLLGPTNWEEYAIGPDSIENFLNGIDGYAAGGAAAYMFGPPAPNVIESAKFVESVLAGQPGEALNAYGRALLESVKDPGWWVQMITASAGMFKGPAATPRLPTPEVPVVPDVPLTPAAAPKPVAPSAPLRLVSSGPGASRPGSVVGRVGSGGSYNGGAATARALAPEVQPAAPNAYPPLRAVPNIEPTPTPAPKPAPAPAAAPGQQAPGVAPSPGPLIPAPIAAAVTALLKTQNTQTQSGPATGAKAGAQTQSSTNTKSDEQKKAGAYPLLWPIALLYPTNMFFARVKSPDRDYSGENQKALKAKRERENGDPDFRSSEYHIHHVNPLFLGGEDLLQSPSKGGNGIILPAGLHIMGHEKLRMQPQMAKPPAPLLPIDTDIYKHPVGTPYYYAGPK